MNCKPGDLAVITGERPGISPDGLTGLFVTVLYRAPDNGTVTAPDGTHINGGFGCWLCEASRAVRVLAINDGGYVSRKYLVVWDGWLRPIRDPGDDAVDEMVLLVGKPRVTSNEVMA